MKNGLLIAGGLLIVLVSSGCLGPPSNGGGSDLSNVFPTPGLPPKCAEYSDDVCALFECLVDRCWCDEGSFPGAVLFEGTASVESEQEAVALVQNFVQSSGSEYTSVERAVSLGDSSYKVFFNVFAYNGQNDEEVFTVSADGAIIKTVCGV